MNLTNKNLQHLTEIESAIFDRMPDKWQHHVTMLIQDKDRSDDDDINRLEQHKIIITEYLKEISK